MSKNEIKATFASRPHILLIRTTIPHMSNLFLAFRGRQSALLSQNLAKNDTNFACHVSCVAADVELRLPEPEVVDKCGVFPDAVVDVHLLRGLTGGSGDDLERVAMCGRLRL